MGLVRGRGFTEFDDATSPFVVVVNQAYVRRFFDEGEDPIGRQMFVITSDSAPREIVGIVEDVFHYALDTDPAPSYYMPYKQATTSSGYWLGATNLVLRTAGETMHPSSSLASEESSDAKSLTALGSVSFQPIHSPNYYF